MTFISVLGFIGAVISGCAYVPQIWHLIRARCTAGLSKKAFGMWLVASILVLINAIYISSAVFIFLTIIQTLASAVIFGFTAALNGKVCSYHAHHNLAPKLATKSSID